MVSCSMVKIIEHVYVVYDGVEDGSVGDPLYVSTLFSDAIKWAEDNHKVHPRAAANVTSGWEKHIATEMWSMELGYSARVFIKQLPLNHGDPQDVVKSRLKDGQAPTE